MNPVIRINPTPRANGWGDDRVEVRTTFYPNDEKLNLKTTKQQIGHQHEYVKRKRKYYHIIISPEMTDWWSFRKYSGGGDILHQERRWQVNSTLQRNSLLQVQGPVHKQYIYQWIKSMTDIDSKLYFVSYIPIYIINNIVVKVNKFFLSLC